jgi:holin-like protein
VTEAARLLAGVAILLACLMGGEWVARWGNLPLPGPVLGMALLTVPLAILGRTPHGLDTVATLLLRAMPLFFIPAGVGIVLLSETFRAAWLPISVALLGSTLVALATTALVMKGLARLLAKAPSKGSS